jgi:hypothetical protein
MELFGRLKDKFSGLDPVLLATVNDISIKLCVFVLTHSTAQKLELIRSERNSII